MSKMKACINVERANCPYELSENSEYDECANCRRGRDTWRKKKPEHVRKRHRLLNLWDYRIQPFLPPGERTYNVPKVTTRVTPPRITPAAVRSSQVVTAMRRRA